MSGEVAEEVVPESPLAEAPLATHLLEAIVVVAAELSIDRAISEDVVGGTQERMRDGDDGFLGTSVS